MATGVPAAVEESVRAEDGTPLVQRTWPVAAGVRQTGSLLLVHGLGEHCRRYDAVAATLTTLGIMVRAYDQRGFGRSGGTRGTLPSPDALAQDAALMFRCLAEERREQGDGQTPFVLGHSMGGAVVARAVTGGSIAPRGMVLSSPALRLRLSAVQLRLLALGSRYAPNLRLGHGLPLDRLSHDPAVERAVRADAEMHDRVTPRLVSFMEAAGRTAIEDAPRCTVPSLLLVAGDDHLVDLQGACSFYQRLPPGVGTFHLYQGLYHELFNEPPEDRRQVLDDLAHWFLQRLGGA